MSGKPFLSFLAPFGMGGAGSKLEKALGDSFPEGERYFGLDNFGNTCYCNSVLQVNEQTDCFNISYDIS